MRILLAPIVTAPPSANTFPARITSAPVVTYAPAITMPLKLVEAPGAKYVSTCQKTFAGLAPFVNRTRNPASVERYPPIWNMKTALGSF